MDSSRNFNSRPCVRGDTAPIWIDGAGELFQFTPLREGRRFPLHRAISCGRRFQFTPLREGRPCTVCTSGAMIYFNSRPCVRGDA